jgi:hypothetical protein
MARLKYPGDGTTPNRNNSVDIELLTSDTGAAILKSRIRSLVMSPSVYVNALMLQDAGGPELPKWETWRHLRAEHLASNVRKPITINARRLSIRDLAQMRDRSLEMKTTPSGYITKLASRDLGIDL